MTLEEEYLAKARENGFRSVTELCREYQCSPKQLYNWGAYAHRNGVRLRRVRIGRQAMYHAEDLAQWRRDVLSATNGSGAAWSEMMRKGKRDDRLLPTKHPVNPTVSSVALADAMEKLTTALNTFSVDLRALLVEAVAVGVDRALGGGAESKL